MARHILLVYFILLVSCGSMALKRCSEEAPPEHNDVHGDPSAIISLADGSTMVAERGTVARRIVDWLASHEPGQKTFELGGHEFVGHSAELTSESLGRASRLVAMLRANPDVKVVIVGHSDPSGDPKADRDISRARAEALVRVLRDGRISPARLSIAVRGASDPIAPNDSPDNRRRNQRVTLILRRTG